VVGGEGLEPPTFSV